MLKPLDASCFPKPKSEFAPGPVPDLRWIEIERLVVDDEYQRDIGRRGAANVTRIAENFDWSKFAPVIVASVEGGRYAIVDGQHRTTAALLRGRDTVPCQIVQADRRQQAAAYAAVNGNITKTTPTQLFHAQVTAGNAVAQAIISVCSAAGVVVIKSSRIAATMKAGQTSAIGALKKCYGAYGAATLELSLKCITKTSDGNPGCLRSTIIEAVCELLSAHPEWGTDEDVLLKHIDKFNFPETWDSIVADKANLFPNTTKSALVEKLEKHLARRFSQSEKKRAA